MGGGAIGADSLCYPPKAIDEPRCYHIVGAPLPVIFQHLGSPKWQGIMPNGEEPLLLFLFENEKCWHMLEYPVGTKQYCITRAGLTKSAMAKEIERKDRQ